VGNVVVDGDTLGWGVGTIALVILVTAIVANWRDVLAFVIFMVCFVGLLWLIGFVVRWAWENFVQWWINR
jgi:hypothetical protein